MINTNGKNGKALLFASLFTLSIAVASIIWAGSKVDSKADQAFRFVSSNQDLPSKVETNTRKLNDHEIKIERFQDILGTVIRIQSKQDAMCEKLDEIAKDLKQHERNSRVNRGE